MIRHIVFIKFLDDATEPAKEDALAKLRVLAGHPKAIGWTGGWNFIERQAYDYALTCEFRTKDDLFEYLGCDDHRVAAQALMQVMDMDRFAHVDYEVPD